MSSCRRSNNTSQAGKNEQAVQTLRENFPYFGYGYLKSPAELVPPVVPTFYSFRVMVILGGYFIALFAGLLLVGKRIGRWKPVLVAVLLSIPLAYLASEAGWIVAEVGRQPWAIQGLLPNCAAVSKLSACSVQTTFWIFAALFTTLLLAELCIMVRAISDGPDKESA